jgi:predicted ATPase
VRRLITLVDALYEARVIVVIQAERPANELLAISADTKRTSQHDEVYTAF